MVTLLQQVPNQLLTLTGLVLSISTAIVHIIYWLMTRKTQKLCYETMVNDSIFHSVGKFPHGLSVSYNGRPIHTPGFVEIKIWNAGRAAIVDFIGPIKFIFGQNVRILWTKVVDSKPQFTDPLVQMNTNEAHLQPLPLNTRNFVKVQMVVERSSNPALAVDTDDPIVDCHVTNLLGITKYSAKGRKRNPLFLCTLGVLSVIMVTLLILSVFNSAFVPSIIYGIGLLLVGLPLIWNGVPS